MAELEELEQEELDKNLLEINHPEELPSVPSISIPTKPGEYPEDSNILGQVHLSKLLGILSFFVQTCFMNHKLHIVHASKRLYTIEDFLAVFQLQVFETIFTQYRNEDFHDITSHKRLLW